jgi:sec-independent protein translocase protein TatC
MEHTVELLTRLRIILISILSLGFLAAFWPVSFKDFFTSMTYTPIISLIMEKMKRDLLPPGVVLIAGNIGDTVYMYMMMSGLIGVILSSPIIGYEMYMFFNPALLPHEKKWAFKIIVPFIGLMFFGAVLAYKLVLPITFKVLLWFILSTGAIPMLEVSEFFSIVVILILATGLTLISPLLLILLAEAGMVNYGQLSSTRKYVYVVFFIVASIVTPDPTPITTLMVFAPWAIIYESSLYAIKRRERRKTIQSIIGVPVTSTR